MGQKVNPVVMRLNINRTWDSRWFATKQFSDLLKKDYAIRKYVHDNLYSAGISRVIVERPAGKAKISIYAARPGLIIGRKGADIEKLKSDLSKIGTEEVTLNILEVRKPEIDAQLVAQSLAQQIERRVAFRRAMKRAIQNALRFGAKGIRINCSGRLGGAEIARTEWYLEGRVPLHTLRADVDYAEYQAQTTYGVLGIKVWIYTGDIMEHDPMAHEKRRLDRSEQRSNERK